MCTTIRIDYPKGTVLGRNMDWEDVPYHVNYIPKGTLYAQDLWGNPLTNKYHMAGLCFGTHLPLKDGINEHGLMGSTNMFIQMNLHADQPREDKISLSSLDFMNYCLGNYKTVAEIKEDLDKLLLANRDHLGKKVIAPHFHYYFVDQQGDSIIIEPKKDILLAKEDRYQIMTNSPALERHEIALEKTLALGTKFNTGKNLPGGLDPQSRFIKAYYYKRTIPQAKDRNTALENAYTILEPLKIPEGLTKRPWDYTYTLYIVAYDNASKLITVRSHTNPRIYKISLDELITGGKPQYIPIPKAIKMDSLPTR